MTLSARSVSTLAIAAAWFALVPHALADKKDNPVKCGDTEKSSTLKQPTSSQPEDLDVVGPFKCTVPASKFRFGAVNVKSGGTLEFSDAKIDFEATSIVVQGGGTLQAGTSDRPIGTADIANRVVIRLVERIAESPPPVVVNAMAHDHAKDMATDDCSTIDKGIAVMSQGTLRLYGVKGIPSRGGVSWTHLAAPAGPADYEKTDQGIDRPVVNGGGGTRLELARDVSVGAGAWKIDDWIVVAGTSFSPFEGEFVQIADVKGTGTGAIVTLRTPLKHYHFGSNDPGPAADAASPRGRSASFSAGKDKNYGVDERAEVGLITRSIRLTAETPSAFTNKDNPNRNRGGETKVCRGFKEAVIEGVEIEKFGKEALGSYPIHFHMAGQIASPQVQRVNANSVHHSYNKCVTIHSTNDAAFENNVCARITGHMFYQEIGDEFRTRLVNNLGVGAMDNNFDLPTGVDPHAVRGWWEGDNLAASLGYTGLNIRNHDNQSNPVHGQCYKKTRSDGSISLDNAYPCGEQTKDNPLYYVEPPTGFWIINPSAVLEGNSIAGCQGVGRGYWYLPPNNSNLQFEPIGKFRNNRVHGCYDGIFGENEAPVVSQTLWPKTGGTNAGFNLIARFEGFTASRIRNRAIWMRPSWFAFENARVATSREGVSLVTSGGADGNAPGVWGLLRYGVVVGLSTNNVDRWGPCADKNQNTVEFPGCVDRNPNANWLDTTKSYPGPAWNFAGFYIYDGPVRIHDTRFVRFRRVLTEVTEQSVVKQKSLLTNADAEVLRKFTGYYLGRKSYEGDAALGWFQSNVSTYPIGTEVRGLEFEETDLRHQVFTDQVNFGAFVDGDKNTAVIDRDGSLTGFFVTDADGKAAKETYPISLNNLPFNASSNAVDECLSEGVQDEETEGRPTSLISPGNMGTLEFGALNLPDGTGGTDPARFNDPAKLKITSQDVTFTKDAIDYGTHQSMKLIGRNNQGIWEPKLTSGLGYTVFASKGIPKYLNIGITDVVKPEMDKHPYYVRLGVCYSNDQGKAPQSPKFTIHRGYRSWAGGVVNYDDPLMRKYYNQLFGLWSRDGTATTAQYCHNLDTQVPKNLAEYGCPADGVVIKSGGACPQGTGMEGKDQRGQNACIFKYEEVAEEKDFTKLAKADGTPDGPKYHYDKDTGMLFLYLVQDRPNAVGSSPLGSCDAAAIAQAYPNPQDRPPPDPACPNPSDARYPENYYNCPAEGCVNYSIEMSDPDYVPGPSMCGGAANDPVAIYAKQPKYVLAEPANANRLAYLAGGKVETTDAFGNGGKYPHRVAKVPPVCTGTP